MESLKEFARGLMGFHLLDKTFGIYSKPSNTRKFIGIILNLYILLPIILAVPTFVEMLFIAAFNGSWGFFIAVLFLGPFAIGVNSILGWIIIDWDKNRVLSKVKRVELGDPP